MSVSIMADKGGQDSCEGDAIKVFVRVRPGDENENQLAIEVDELRNAIIVNAKPEPKVFSFDRVVDIDITQEAVFCAVGKSIIDGCVKGYNGTIFAYGQTGSGKTFTMLGPSEDSQSFQHELRGIIPRSFEYLFSLIRREQELHGDRKEFLCRCSFLELYQEQIYDLLDYSAEGLPLRENIKKGVFVEGLREIAVTSASEAYQVLTSGWINRRVAATSMNRESSRSHAVFTLAIESKEQNGGIQNMRMSQLNLVDLAGSERQKDTNAAGKRLKEAGSINRSLSVLGNVIMALTHGKSKHIPYRDSKLTFLLRNSLGGNAYTNIVACVHPGNKCYGETLSTLMFARRAKLIKNKAVVNEDTQGNILHLQAEIRRLKDQILHYQNEGGPRLVVGSESTSGTVMKGCDSLWRKNFIEAMYFKEKTEIEKKNLIQIVKDLEEVGRKREKFNRCREMVMKFREKDIENLKREINKLKTSGGDEDQDVKENNQIVALKEEVKVLTDRIKSDPVVFRQNMEIQKLKGELQLLKSNDSYRESILGDKRRVEELDKAFKELIAEKSKLTATDDDDSHDKKMASPYTTPQSMDVSVATLEKYKSQVDSLQKALQTLKLTLAETRETAEKKIIELGAELSSAKQTNEEVMRSLKLRKMHYNLEKKNLNEMHCRTIETITTPQKHLYNLLNRTLPGSPLPMTPVSSISPELNQTFETEEGNHEEDIQKLMNQTAYEALTEEIGKLQDKNRKLDERIEEYESDIRIDRQESLKYENKIEQLNQILKKERSEWALKDEEYQKMTKSMEKELEVTKVEARVNQEKANDMEVLFNQFDKEKADLVKKFKENDEIRQKAVETLETKLMNMSMEFEQLRKSNEELSKDLDVSQEQLEAKDMTIVFQENLMKEHEDDIKKHQEENLKLQTEIKNLEENLEQKASDVERLQAQIMTDSATLEEMTVLKSANTQLQNECDDWRNNEMQLKTELEKRNVCISSLENELAKDRESVASLWNTIQEQKSKINTGKEKQLSLESQLTNRTQQNEALQTMCERQARDISHLQEQVDKQQEAENTLRQKFEVEWMVAQETMEDMREEMERVHEELQETSNQLTTSQTECENLQEKMVLLRNELKRKDEENNFSDKTMQELEELMNKNDITIQEKNDTITRLQREMGEAEWERNSLHKTCSLLESDLQEKHAELSLLESQIKDKEEISSRAEQEAAEAKLQCEDMRRSKVELSERISDLEKRLEEIISNNENLTDENKRLVDVATKDLEEMSIMHSELEVLREHYSKSQTDLEQERCRAMDLEEMIGKLGGHLNHKQKINLFQRTREENSELHTKFRKLTNEHFVLKMELAKYLPSTPKSTDSHLKDNILPGSQSSHCERTKSILKSKQTLFSSGDYAPSDSLKKVRLEAKSAKKTKQVLSPFEMKRK